MLFRFIATVASVAFIAQGTLAAPALTIEQVVTNIGVVTDVSRNAADTLSSITPQSSSPDVTNAGQSLVNDFTNIVQSLAGDVTAMKATPPFSDCEATQAIIDALTDFVAIHQNLLSVVIGKRSEMAQFGATAPIATALESLEAGIDSFAFAMIKMLPSCNTASVQQDQSALDTSVGNAKTLYQQPCIPSPLYPNLPPVCASL